VQARLAQAHRWRRTVHLRVSSPGTQFPTTALCRSSARGSAGRPRLGERAARATRLAPRSGCQHPTARRNNRPCSITWSTCSSAGSGSRGASRSMPSGSGGSAPAAPAGAHPSPWF